MGLIINTTSDAAKTLVVVSGEVDVSNAAELRAALDGTLGRTAGEGAIEVDLSDVPYIDSTGIGVLVGAARHAQERSLAFVVARPQRNVARVLALLGVGAELGIQA